MYYIQETDKPVWMARILNLIEIIDDKIILPINKEEALSNKKITILAKRIKKILDKTNCKSVVLSKKLKKEKSLLELLGSYNIKIIDGKWLFEVLSSKVLDYIILKKNLKKEETNVSILINNNNSDYIIENIKTIIRTHKSVNIVTIHIEKFKKMEKELLEEEGNMITITNNKKKSLARSKIILNIDFESKELNKYNIP